MNDRNLRENLLELLKDGHAHITFDGAIDGLKPENRNISPENFHSVWQLLEHIRIAQEDIIRYTLDEKWVSPKWPDEFWVHDMGNISDEKWNNSLKKYYKDFNDVIKLAQNETIDLTSKIPHGEGRTYLRQILLIADHNAYHIAQIVAVRKIIDDWK